MAAPRHPAMYDLYDEARALIVARRAQETRDAETEAAAHVSAVSLAQSQLLSRLLDGFQERVMEAAREGRCEMELLAFEGGDTFDDEFCYLYLLRGPRQPDSFNSGIAPLLPALRGSLAPFRVRHVWKQGTVQNSLVVAWDGPAAK